MTKTTKPAKKDADANEALIKLWRDRLEAGIKNQKKIFDIAKENYEIYYAKTSSKQKAQSPWKSNVFLPLLPGKARDTKAKLSVIEPRFRAIPADSFVVDEETGDLNFDAEALKRSLKVSKKLNKEYQNYSPTGGQPPKAAVDFSLTDAIVAGWGLGLAPLDTYEKKYTTYKPLVDANGNESAYVDDKTGEVKTLRRVSTQLIPLDIFRCYLSPKAKSWLNPHWTMIEREETYASLLKKGIYDLPAELKQAKATATKNDYSAIRDAALGYQEDGSDFSDETVNPFNVYDCYDEDKDTFYTFVEAKLPSSTSPWIKIYEEQNPYNHGLNTIVPFYVKQRPHSPWGESFFEISKDVQFAYNASYNQFADNATLSGETMALVDKNSIVDGYEVGPGNTVTWDSMNGEKPEAWKLQDPNPAVLNARNEILEKNAENGTTPQYNSGQVNSSMDKTAGTKGGIEMLMEAANDKLAEMLRNLKGSLLRYGYISMHNAQQFQNYIEVLDLPDMSAAGVQKMENGIKAKAYFITPMDLQDAFDLSLDDESLLPLTKTEKRAVFKDFVDTLVSFQKASIEQAQAFDTPEDLMRIDWSDLSKEVGAQYSELNAPAFIKEMLTREELAQKKIDDAAIDQQATEGAAKIAQANNPDADVNQDPNGISVQRQKRELSNFKDYPSDVKNAVLESFGYPASQLIDEKAKAEVAEAQSQQLDVQVKQQMIEAAAGGQIDPATLSKFIKK